MAGRALLRLRLVALLALLAVALLTAAAPARAASQTQKQRQPRGARQSRAQAQAPQAGAKGSAPKLPAQPLLQTEPSGGAGSLPEADNAPASDELEPLPAGRLRGSRAGEGEGDLCSGDVSLYYLSGVNGGWGVASAVDAAASKVEELLVCTFIRGTLSIDARWGTGDGMPSAAPLGAEVTVPDLPALRSVGALNLTGAFHDLDGLRSLEIIAGHLELHSTNELVRVNGLDGLKIVKGDLLVRKNHVLRRIDGLNGLRTIGGDLRVTDNPELVAIHGLRKLERVGGVVFVRDNISLVQVDGLGALKTVGTGSLGAEGVQEFVVPGHVNCVLEGSALPPARPSVVTKD